MCAHSCCRIQRQDRAHGNCLSMVTHQIHQGRLELPHAAVFGGWMRQHLPARPCCEDAWLARGWCCRSCGRTFFDYWVHVRLQEWFLGNEIPHAPNSISEASVQSTRSGDLDSAESCFSSPKSTPPDGSNQSVRACIPSEDSVAENLSNHSVQAMCSSVEDSLAAPFPSDDMLGSSIRMSRGKRKQWRRHVAFRVEGR